MLGAPAAPSGDVKTVFAVCEDSETASVPLLVMGPPVTDKKDGTDRLTDVTEPALGVAEVQFVPSKRRTCPVVGAGPEIPTPLILSTETAE